MKKEVNELLVNIAIILILFALMNLILFKDYKDKNDSKNDSKNDCDKYLNLSLRDIPDNCYSYWKENKIDK